MKAFYFLTIIIALFLSCKKEKDQRATVIKDCTGTYLRVDKKDYHVCNLEKVASFPDGAVVTTTFKRLTNCNGSAIDVIVCMMAHENAGWINVEKIK